MEETTLSETNMKHESAQSVRPACQLHSLLRTRCGKRSVNISSGWVIQYAVLTIFFLHCIARSGAVELHVSKSDPGGVVIYNASLGHGWSYHIDHSKSKYSQLYLQLDSSTGLIYWMGIKGGCIIENPVVLNVVSRTWQLRSDTVSSVLVMPFAVFVHGCEEPHRTLKYTRLKENKLHDVKVQSVQTLPECIPPSTPLATLTDFIPIALHQCQIIVDLPDFSPVMVDHNTLALSSVVQMCLVQGRLTAEFSVSVLCNLEQLFQIPYRIFFIQKEPRPKLLSRRRRAVNNRPVFRDADQGKYIVHVKEELPPGQQIVTITASDNDTEGAGTLTYSMITNLDDRSQNMFAINPLTGTINTTQKLDREYMIIHHFYVIATDHGIPPLSATAELDIIVDDVNDHAPQFEPPGQFDLPENQQPGYPVLTLQAKDSDFGLNSEIRYSIVNTNNAFQINPATGAISTLRALDREMQDNYVLLIQAVDQGDLADRKSSTATVNITITDENDNSPVFAPESYEVSIREDQPVSPTQPIVRVTATDRDSGRNAQILYQLSGNNQEKFSINANTGEVYLMNPLDYEETREYSLTVRAEDQGVVSKRGTATLLVRIIDINDNTPYFTSPSYHGSVTENIPVGFSVIQVQAFDHDSGVNSDLTYSLVAGGSNVTLPLAIDAKSGWIRTTGTIDRETNSEYTLNVKVTDGGQPQKSATTIVVITVRDTNDNAPIFIQRVYEANISEEARIGDEVVRVVAIDADDGENARVVYEITTGNTGDAFQIMQSTNQGVISVKKLLDARQQNRYTLTVTATDSSSLRDTVQVFISVTDTNRYAPEFQATPFQFSVDENIDIGRSVYKVRAIDRDRGENARLTYSLDPGVTAFSIDPNTGDIFTRVNLDRESTPNYRLRVTATDNGNPQLRDTEDIDVTINDENDNKPEFTETLYTGSVKEYPESLPGEKVLQITARDRDKDANGQVYYTFEGGSDGNGDFSIDSAMGIIRVAKPLDRERIPNYELVALAVDRGTPQALSSSVIIRIRIEDVNDNRPKFAADQLDVYIVENSPIGSTVALITATDPDEGVNALVEYSKDGGPDVDSFQLSGRRGEPAIITTLISLDYEGPKKRYEIVLRAASGTLFSTTRIFINVRDVNDNSPVLHDFSIIYNNYAASFPNGPIGRIPAEDPDVSDQELLRYNILSGNEANLLHLNTTTGTVILDSRLNSDVPRNGTFLVSVSDGKNIVRATCRLFVRLVTPEMLHNSVTIRLNRMTQTAFLSSLLKFFSDALASIFNTDPTNIFIINIENDVDVAPAQILNVSVSVRQGSISVQGRTQDVFFSPEYLREYIYLYRSLLANLSALEVLPFDDNLCLVEPCPSFAICLSTVVQGQAQPFIASDTVLFRPIHPENGYRCQCPHGFAGKTFANNCDVEVDLCYSMPCYHGGTCLPHESGYTCVCSANYTGPNCEVSMTMKYDAITCPVDFCRPPSVCVPLIKGGFRCDGCPDDGNYDEFCRLRTASFRKGSYMTFPSIKTRNRFTIRLKFATQEKNGLLLYNGRFNEEHDFVGLEIVDSQVTFSFSTGSNRTSVSSYVKGGVSTGQWFDLTLEYYDRVVTLTVGKDCDTDIAILYGSQLDNYTCAARATLTLPSRCDNPTNECHRLLDLTGPLQLGGLPWASSTGQVTQQDFIGCVSNVYIDDRLLDLNRSVVSIQTEVGCPQKKEYCRSSPCTLGGKCSNGWTTFTCDCPEKAGGKDCSETIDTSKQLRGNGYLSYTEFSQKSILYSTWYNGLSFRTRANNGTLLQIILNNGFVRMRLSGGFIVYTYKNVSLTLDSVRVSDGQWHFIEARWYQGQLELLLDYSQRQKSLAVTEFVSGNDIQIIYVGGFRQGNDPITDGFVGCVKDIRVGNHPSALLFNPKETNVLTGCSAPNQCDPNPCGAGTCEDVWGGHVCHCPPGMIGPQCQDICTNYNPCQNWAECRRPKEGESTYTCECGSRQSGRYCQNMAPLECPAAWWGNPVCGPCNCNAERGFNKNCDKKNGTCYCKELHYQPSGSDQCFPCDCYTVGSKDTTCDSYTGQCNCNEGVIGRRCDQCDSKFAGIVLEQKTCRVSSYENCPRSYSKGIWWDPVAFGSKATQDCPPGASGSARRECTEVNSWLEADLSNCTSDNFTRLLGQLQQMQAGIISPYSADMAIEMLKNATNTTRPLYGGDIVMTLQFAAAVLDYENRHSGLELISQQYRDFVQQLIIALSNVTGLANSQFWPAINRVHNGAASLLRQLEAYLVTIAGNMPQAQSGPFEAVSDGIILGSDWISVYNVSNRPVPKYDNIINKGSANDYASIILPSSLFDEASIEGKSYYGYTIYHTLGKLLDVDVDTSIVKTGLPLTTNGPTFTFVLTKPSGTVTGKQTEPVYVRLKLAAPHNRTNLQCALWRPTADGRGVWSGSECSVSDTNCQVTSESDDKCHEVYITCKCYHLSTFAIIVDLEDGTLLRAAVIQLEVLMYVLVGLSLVLLVCAFFILISYKRLQCNWNSIHINLVFVVIISELAFAVGINRTNPELFCRLVAISLHYFYMAAFAWLFVEVLHIHRMLTEKQTINFGSMKFYYLLGYVIPGIIVGLAVGLYTEGYGNDSFCWLETSQLLIWSFAGPIVAVVVMTIITFMIAVKASCREKVHVDDLSSVRLGLMGAIILLLLLSITWVLGLLTVNFELPALGYVHSIFLCLQGFFLFLVYILLSSKVRLSLRITWYKMQGKKLGLDDTLAGTRGSVTSRSALAYRNDTGSSTTEGGGGLRINVGISTTSTTSQSSRSTGRYPSRFRRDDFGRSTSSSTSGGHIPSLSGQPPNTGIAPYGYDPNAEEVLPEDVYEAVTTPTRVEHNDSDSDSDASADRNSLDLASSHSSDEDDDFEIGPAWDQHVSKSKTVVQAREQLEKHKKEKKERERLGNNNSAEDLWVDSDQVDVSTGLDLPPTSRPHISSVPPDVTLSAAAQRSGRNVTIVPPVRSDSLQNNYATSSSNVASEAPTVGREQVQVLTHNGSVSSDSESSDETNV